MYISCQNGECLVCYTRHLETHLKHPVPVDGIWPGRQTEEVIRLRKILGELVLSKKTKGLLAWISRERPESRQ